MSEIRVNWFEIPVSNVDRTIGFYETLLGLPLDSMDGVLTS